MRGSTATAPTLNEHQSDLVASSINYQHSPYPKTPKLKQNVAMSAKKKKHYNRQAAQMTQKSAATTKDTNLL